MLMRKSRRNRNLQALSHKESDAFIDVDLFMTGNLIKKYIKPDVLNSQNRLNLLN